MGVYVCVCGGGGVHEQATTRQIIETMLNFKFIYARNYLKFFRSLNVNMNLCEFSKPLLDVIFTWGNICFQSSEVENALFPVTSIAISDSQV